MDDSTRNRIDAAIATEVAESAFTIDQEIEAVFSELSANGRLLSGSMANLLSQQIAANCTRLLDRLFVVVSAISKESDAYVLLRAAALAYLEFGREKLTSSIASVLGSTPSPALIEAGETMFARQEGPFRSRLDNKAFEFPIPSPMSELDNETTQQVNVKSQSSTGAHKPGGRPRADFWDDLLIAVFTQIYLGKWEPTTQAVILRAMQKWVDAREIDVSDSSLKARARKLFDSLHGDDK